MTLWSLQCCLPGLYRHKAKGILLPQRQYHETTKSLSSPITFVLKTWTCFDHTDKLGNKLSIIELHICFWWFHPWGSPGECRQLHPAGPQGTGIHKILQSCAPYNTQVHKPTSGSLKVKWHIYCHTDIFLNHLTCLKWHCHFYYLSIFLFLMCHWRSSWVWCS